MCSLIAKMQKKVVVAQSLGVPSLKPMGRINIQTLETELESFPVVVDWSATLQALVLPC